MPVSSDDGDDLIPQLSIDAESGDSHVIDDAQYSHQRRLRAIHNAHDRVIQVRNAVEDRLISGQLNQFHARRYYRGSVESFLMEIFPVLRSDDIKLSKDYLRESDLGTVVIKPPQELVSFARGNIQRLAPGARVPTRKTTDVVGLRAVLELPSPLQHRFAVPVRKGSGIETAGKVVQEELPRDVLDAAVQQAMEALDDAQMGLNIGEGRPHNSAGTEDGKWPWETDMVLPHEIHDALESGDITRDELQRIMATSKND